MARTATTTSTLLRSLAGLKAYSFDESRIDPHRAHRAATAEFEVVSVANPYGCSDAATLSLYRRPLPSTNLRFNSAVMWDGRESSPLTGTQSITFATNPADLLADLSHQALDATNGHAQASTQLTTQQRQAIVDFEMGAFDRSIVRLPRTEH